MLSDNQVSHETSVASKPQVLFETPRFTTPSLDFADHSTELNGLIDQLYRYRNSYFIHNASCDSDLSLSAQERTQRRDQDVINVANDVSRRFKQLTTPPTKKRQTAPRDAHLSRQRSSLLDVSDSTTLISLNYAFDPTLNITQRAYYHYLRGKLRNILPTFDAQAEDDLTKAVKLDPTNVHAWNTLGESFGKKGDLLSAQRCFEAALRQRRNGESFCLLAMVTRQKSDKASIEKSIELCKNAIKLDIRDSMAWYGLGISYVKLFFGYSHDKDDLKKALSAYNRTDPKSVDPDLFQNRSIIHHYIENYHLAYADFKRASDLDPFYLETFSNWSKQVGDFLSRCSSLIVKQANLSETNMENIVSKLKSNEFTVHFKECKPATISSLQTGNRDASCISLQLVSYVNNESTNIFGTFIGMDENQDFAAISVFNVVGDVFRAGSIVTIRTPQFSIIHAPQGIQDAIGQSIKEYPSIRLDSPQDVAVNGKLLSSAAVAYSGISIDLK